MKTEQRQKNGRKRSDLQGDTVIKQVKQEQVQVPFLYRSVKDPFEKRREADCFGKKLYRVIKIK